MKSTWPGAGCFVTVGLFMAICLPKCRFSLQDLTLTKRYIESFGSCQAPKAGEGEKLYFLRHYWQWRGKHFFLVFDHMWKPPEKRWEGLCRVLHLGHQSRMSCSDNILEKQKKEHIFILKLVRQCCGFIFTFYSFRCILVSLKHVSIFFFSCLPPLFFWSACGHF